MIRRLRDRHRLMILVLGALAVVMALIGASVAADRRAALSGPASTDESHGRRPVGDHGFLGPGPFLPKGNWEVKDARSERLEPGGTLPDGFAGVPQAGQTYGSRSDSPVQFRITVGYRNELDNQRYWDLVSKRRRVCLITARFQDGPPSGRWDLVAGYLPENPESSYQWVAVGRLSGASEDCFALEMRIEPHCFYLWDREQQRAEGWTSTVPETDFADMAGSGED